MMQPRLLLIYHAAKRHYLKPEPLDLTWPGCLDRITGHEEYESWGIDPMRWLPQ